MTELQTVKMVAAEVFLNVNCEVALYNVNPPLQKFQTHRAVMKILLFGQLKALLACEL